MVHTLLYYHIFDFALTSAEIRRFSSHSWVDTGALESALSELVDLGLVGDDDGLFFIGETSHAAQRRADESRASGVRSRAVGWSRFIARFPYVRGVAISGTLSKGVMKENDDLDYLVFTEPGRVWLCRLILMAFKKVFLLNSHHRFCVNYLLAEDSLEIPDHDLFTATEIAWLLPMVNPGLYRRFVEANAWVRDMFPNWRPRAVDDVLQVTTRRLRRATESLIELFGGARLDGWSQRLIARRNERRYSHLRVRHEVALRSAKHASKHHPRGFQERVLRSLADEIGAFEARHGVELGLPEGLAP